MTITQVSILLMTAFTMAGCSTPYIVDRSRDAKDVFTATVGWGAGAKARVGPVNAGFFGNGDRAGLRAGSGFVKPRCMGEMCELTTPLPVFPGLHGGWFGLHSLENCDEPCAISERRNKGYSGFGIVVPGIMTHMDAPAPYYSQIEVAGGLIITLRVGFNPGELLDFVLGWSGVDIYGDDLETRRQKTQSNNPAQATGKPAPGR